MLKPWQYVLSRLFLYGNMPNELPNSDFNRKFAELTLQ